jgi:hypothetical protein
MSLESDRFRSGRLCASLTSAKPTHAEVAVGGPALIYRDDTNRLCRAAASHVPFCVAGQRLGAEIRRHTQMFGLLIAAPCLMRWAYWACRPYLIFLMVALGVAMFNFVLLRFWTFKNVGECAHEQWKPQRPI